MLSEAGVDDAVKARIKEVERKYSGTQSTTGGSRSRDQSNLVHELVGNLRDLLSQYVPEAEEGDSETSGDDEREQYPDRLFMSVPQGSGG